MYKDKNLSYDERAKDLLSKMTLDEKIEQMIGFYAKYKDYGKTVDYPACSCVFQHPPLDDTIDRMQDHYLKETRLGIPMLIAYECLHGMYDPRATVFPQSAGLGGTFNRELIAEMADVIGQEAEAIGVRHVYAPDLDIPRDPRWGRMQECYGEDPYLVGEYGVRYVKGIQDHGVAATAKHFIGYGVPESGINLSSAHIGERELREVYLEPFRKVIDAGVMTVMPAYNEIDGEPVHASKKLLRGLLREELGFDGMIISDYGATDMLTRFHGVAKDGLTAGKMAIEAGVDMEMPRDYGYGSDFKAAVARGEIDEKLVDEAVLRVLKLKLRLGLFEDPYIKPDAIKAMHSPRAVELSREMDEQAILLLKNDGILPLDEKKVGKVAVIGNNAKETYLGNYIGPTEHCVSFYDGMVNRLGEDRVLFAQGCEPIFCDDELIAEAVEQAKKADVVFLVMGDRSNDGGGVGGGKFVNRQITCGEGYDAHDLKFHKGPQKLFDAIAALKKPTVLIVYAGRPYTIKEEVERVNGFMFSWGGGEQSGNAFANLIFGDRSPSAKLSISFPQSVGHIPCYYNHKASARGRNYKQPGSPEQPGRDYVLSSPAPWYPFGYGLSYTTVEYSDLTADVQKDGTVKVGVTVRNAGDYDIDESVLLFVRAHYAPIVPFVKKLRNFEKVHLPKGAEKRVEFLLTDEDFTYVDSDLKNVKLSGEYSVMIDSLECEFTVE